MFPPPCLCLMIWLPPACAKAKVVWCCFLSQPFVCWCLGALAARDNIFVPRDQFHNVFPRCSIRAAINELISWTVRISWMMPEDYHSRLISFCNKDLGLPLKVCRRLFPLRLSQNSRATQWMVSERSYQLMRVNLESWEHRVWFTVTQITLHHQQSLLLFSSDIVF
jgi:hypothetical protein